MSNIPKEMRYTKEHEWVRIEGEMATVGITDHAQSELGDIVFVELPEEDDEVEAGDGVAVVESVKAVSDVYAPLSGRIAAVNTAVEDSPELVNEDSYGEGWLFRIQISDPDEIDDLLTAEAYSALVAEED